ncbi:MAG: hypothetical protein ABW217_03485 [Polyangiaceae bacterium]
MASISQLESLLARVRRRAAEPRPGRRPTSRVALRSYAEIEEDEIEDADLEEDDIEDYKGELVEIVDEPFALAPASPPVRQSPIPASPVTQRSEPPPPPPPLPSVPVPPPPPSWGSVAARARRSLRPVPPPPPAAVPTALSAVQPSVTASVAVAAEAVVSRSPVPSTANAAVAEARGQPRAGAADGFDELLERSLELGR